MSDRLKRSCRPRTNPALLRELDSLVRQEEWLTEQIARVELAMKLMVEGGGVLERELS